jgi:hypothetical protein
MVETPATLGFHPPGYCALVLNHEFAAGGVPSDFTEKQLFREAPDPFLGGHVHVSDFSLNRSILRTHSTINCGEKASLNLNQRWKGISSAGWFDRIGAEVSHRSSQFSGSRPWTLHTASRPEL